MNEEHNFKIRKMKGWFDEEDIQLFDFVMTKVNEDGVSGDIAEIGIYYGKSLAKLASFINLDYGEKILAIDSYIRDNNQHNEIIRNIQAVSSCSNSDINILTVDSYRTDIPGIGNKFYHNCKVVHLDGSHAGINVYHDLELADKLMDDYGVLILDDWNNKTFPHIQEAYYKYSTLHPVAFEKFLISNRKCYLCRPNRLSSWLWHTETKLPEFLKTTNEGQLLLSKNSIIKTENYVNNSTIVMFEHNEPIEQIDHAYTTIHNKYGT